MENILVLLMIYNVIIFPTWYLNNLKMNKIPEGNEYFIQAIE